MRVLLFLLKVHLFLLLLFCVLNSYSSVFFLYILCIQRSNDWCVKHSITYRGTEKCNSDFLNCYSNILVYLLVINMPSRGYNMQTLVYKSLAPVLYMKSCSLSLVFMHSCWIPYPPWGKVCFCCRVAGKSCSHVGSSRAPFASFQTQQPFELTACLLCIPHCTPWGFPL